MAEACELEQWQCNVSDINTNLPINRLMYIAEIGKRSLEVLHRMGHG
jgi:hypothetical protein